MSELPAGWEACALGDVFDIAGGGTPQTADATNFTESGSGHAWLTPSDLSGYRRKSISHGARDLTSKGLKSCSANLIPAGSVLFTSRAPIGYVAVAECEVSTNQGFKSFVLPDRVDPSYLYYYLKSIREIAESRGTGTTFKELSGSAIKELPFVLAPFEEQRRITQKLDLLLAQVDALQARVEAIPRLIQRFRDSVLRTAVSGRLTEAWRSAHPEKTSARLLHDFSPLPPPPRYKSRSDAHIMGVCATSIGKPKSPLVEAWEWVPLVQIARMESGHTPSKDTPGYWNGDVPWIGIRDARANHEGTIFTTLQTTNQSGLDNSAARLLPVGTVCISRTASVGYVVKMGTPMATSQDFVNWVPTQYLDAEWLKWLFVAEKESLFRFGKGSTHTTVYFPEWLSLHVALPHIEEQIEIAKRVQELLTLADSMAARVSDAQKRIEALTQSLLAKAFRGELVPQDPSDEPAKVVLERIRAQRAAFPKPKRGRRAASN